MSSSFLVKKTRYSRFESKRFEEGKLTIQPQKVFIQEYTIDENQIYKLQLHNETNKALELKIEQPKRMNVKVKVRKNVIEPK